MNSRERLTTACNWLMAGTAVVFSAVVFVQLFSVPPQSSRAAVAVKPFVPPQPVAAIQAPPPGFGMKAPVGVPAPAGQPQMASAPAGQQPAMPSTSTPSAQPGMIRGPQGSNPWMPAGRTPGVPIPNLNPHTLPPGYRDF